jgi:hypothetical protein
MPTTTTHESPDGLLRFQIVREDDGETMLGFENLPWHTHGDLLVGSYGATLEAAVNGFVSELLSGQSIIALYRRSGELYDICITADPQSDRRHLSSDESVEFRHWDGSSVPLEEPSN